MSERRNSAALNLYQWWPFDAHVQLWRLRARISVGHFYRSIEAGFVLYVDGPFPHWHGHVKLNLFFGVSVGVFWCREGDQLDARHRWPRRRKDTTVELVELPRAESAATPAERSDAQAGTEG